MTGGNPFKSMMQAWKYSLPAFLVPFLFSASKEGANLLIIDATWPGFIQACVNSSACLFFLSIGICVLALSSATLLILPPREAGPRGLTGLELTDAENGRKIFGGVLSNDEPIVLTWKNSLFGLMVTEVFAARAGRLDLTQVTFADPRGLPPPAARPEDLDDLYHTGRPFQVQGLARPLSRAVFRIGEIGNPVMTIAGRTIHLKQEAGFGGAVLMQARTPHLRLIGGSLGEIQAYLRDLIIPAGE